MNHADDPNSDGIKAIRDIKKGEGDNRRLSKVIRSNGPHPIIKK